MLYLIQTLAHAGHTHAVHHKGTAIIPVIVLLVLVLLIVNLLWLHDREKSGRS